MSKFYGVRYQKFGAVLPPLGMGYIVSYLKRHDYSAALLDANALNIQTKQILEIIKDRGINLVGLYATTLGYKEAADMAEEIKAQNPRIKIILGGAAQYRRKGGGVAYRQSV